MLDLAKVLATNTPVSFGQLLANLPQAKLDEMMTLVKQLSTPESGGDPAMAAELAAVQAAVTANTYGGQLPENMFVPFTLVGRDLEGKLKRDEKPVIHYGNADTGSMVNVLYSGVLSANQGLEQYRADFQHMIRGVGEKITKVICKLVDVPVSLGYDQAPGSLIKATFYVIDCPSYHFIIGLTLLSVVNGQVHCGARRLTYTLGPAGKGAQQDLGLVSRDVVQTSPAFKAVHQPATNI